MANRVTPIGLAGLFLIGGLIAAAFGTTAIAGWLDGKDNDTLRDLAPKVQAIGVRTGLDRPYQFLHRLVRDAESSTFTRAH